MRVRRTCLIVFRPVGMAVRIPSFRPFTTSRQMLTTTPPAALHFHLSISVPGSKNPTAKTPGGGADTTTFDDTEFQYEPRLNDERDRDLLDILPDYLTEDICFPRSNAARFYARVVDCLTKRVEVVEEGGEDRTEVEDRTMGGAE
jgi:hypothetical protein